ncbi:neutral zinc metallopeptidase [Terrabacter sp. MAHUQ-38]|uniref:KPN_02809 family neutral zinc metallopeptidase n=1 Tax=unclassified Terrabacter TaxID=2630222 RepID=UPI00165E422C|nr:neutral zinc metallopeptidase [Terrabacter sp. MAHUQ-38]MBC9823354.1 neutral zinc metallopeptidase [Terrabacter sp. MAHUQ-38]
MSFNDNAQLDTSQVESGGSGGFGGGGGGGGFPGGIQVGGGIGGLILLVLMLIFGGGNILGGGDSGSSSGGLPSQQLEPDQVGAAGQVDQGDFSQCKTGADANKNDVCLVIATVNSVQDYWEKTLPKYQMNYEMAKTVVYQGQTQSGCGTANSQVGPFYCPLDSKVYVDASFFQELQSKFGADGGQLAKEYVIAHEYGHHIQNLLGVLNRAQQDPQGPNSGAVRIELMADCLAGTWVKHATETTDASGTPLLKQITEDDIRSALSAAAAVGDDRIQEKMQGRVTPESWTHGSAEARMNWFTQGYRTGDINQCNTFGVDTVS